MSELLEHNRYENCYECGDALSAEVPDNPTTVQSVKFTSN